ncbi:putative transcription regulator protein [Marinomonas sp. MED121]|uniref:LysR family transcriptional regulator n=1 Tax=Marinomonas sp. MED121 TaxID=314277 RepID=UPI000068FA37|nr:LysR family transcriptional regulator [Marinomonas sp. MED121]EAQ64109.1 putative transcription regulator protein [Marinomonas sp. MED121]
MVYKMNKIRALTVFRRVVELGSFKGAAEDLNLSKAAVSKNINELEEELQSPLINRTTRKLHITESGRLYYQQVCHVLDCLKNADQSIIESLNTLKGTLKISVPMSLGIIEINPIIFDFMAEHPDLHVEVVMNDKYVDLIEQEIDISIRGGGVLNDSSLRSRKLTDMKRVLCASPDYLAQASKLNSPDDLVDHNCLIYSFSLSARRWLFKYNDQVKEVELTQGSFIANNGLVLKQAACLGHGIVLLPDLFVNNEIEQGQLVEVLPQWSADKHSLYLVYPFHKEKSHKIRAFIDFFTNHYLK